MSFPIDSAYIDALAEPYRRTNLYIQRENNPGDKFYCDAANFFRCTCLLEIN